MDTLNYAIASTLNKLARDRSAASLVLPEPEFQPLNVALLFCERNETQNSVTRFNDQHGHVSNALHA